MDGIVYKGIGGFYYVKCGETLIECKPRGLFRKDGTKLVAGDHVQLAEEAGTLYIEEVFPRKNVFIRPPVANVDQFFIIVSTVEPSPSYLVIDKMTAVAIDRDAQPVVVVTKTDRQAADEILDIYRKAGIPAYAVNPMQGTGLEPVKQRMKCKLSVFTGNSGVGKSTLLNAIIPGATRQVGEISHKLGRGRHTTREVEIFEAEGGLVADTPGFASFDLQRVSPIQAENLQFAFPEVRARMEKCRFTGCSHVAEDGCAVRQALSAGEISESRYQSYVNLYKEAKENQKY